MSARLLLLATATVAAVSSSFGGFNVDLVSGSATKRQTGRYVTMTVWSNSTVHVTGSGTMDLLLVGGGGGGGYGGSQYAGGGGGGGQVLYRQSVEVQAKDYEIVIGVGGAVNANGGDTEAFDLTARGGGAGGSSATLAGSDGGNGGGAASGSGEGGKGCEDGHKGGVGVADNVSWTLYGGGGGGADGDGCTAIGTGTTTGSTPGLGGAGRACGITGEDIVYGAGGGG